MNVLKDFIIRDMLTGAFCSGSKADENRVIRLTWAKKPRRFRKIADVSSFLSYVTEPIQPTWEVIEYESHIVSRFPAITIRR
jgi:hypothetical protein